jgi:Na+/H+ antiporter NhaD/arsenite permease-like protein
MNLAPILAIGVTAGEPHLVMVAPFTLLLLAIALMPFVAKHWWEHNYPKVSVSLGLIVVAYYLVVLHNGPRMVTTAVEYAGFIALIGSLFVIAGGIHINMSGNSTPATNTGLLALGAILANLIGTTGASMLLIRPFLRINKYRVAPFQVVFFIFIVSNVGGALTPIGDPPLFLGYLKGVPFFWLLTKPNVLLAWLTVVGTLLALFFVLDTLNYRKHKPVAQDETKDRVELEGSHNFLWLFVIIGLVLVQKAEWLKELCPEHVIVVVVAGLMLVAAALAYRFSNQDALKENEFSFAPVREVSFLFAGIFATMVPALDLLERHASDIGVTTVRQFYWASGLLSSVLDNAPTYLNFLTASFGLHHFSLEIPENVTRFLADPSLSQYLVAVALGSVFFGANTYIGNGPNFMVKSIAEASGVKCPSFFGYVCKYSLPILIPLFAIVSWLFLR